MRAETFLGNSARLSMRKEWKRMVVAPVNAQKIKLGWANSTSHSVDADVWRGRSHGYRDNLVKR